MLNRKEYNKEYYLKNKREIGKKRKQYYKDNSEEIKKSIRQWLKDNPGYRKEYNNQYYQNNLERLKEISKQYYKNNKEKIIKQSKQWYKDNIEKIRQKKYYKNNPEKIKEFQKKYQRNKYKTDLKYNLSHKLSVAIYLSLKGNKKGRHWENLVGYTLKKLIKRLKKTVPEGYTWNNFINGRLHIDHIIPINAFNFTEPEHTDFKKCWALSNLRLLPAKENQEKSDKLEKPFQPSLMLINL